MCPGNTVRALAARPDRPVRPRGEERAAGAGPETRYLKAGRQRGTHTDIVSMSGVREDWRNGADPSAPGTDRGVEIASVPRSGLGRRGLTGAIRETWPDPNEWSGKREKGSTEWERARASVRKESAEGRRPVALVEARTGRQPLVRLLGADDSRVDRHQPAMNWTDVAREITRRISILSRLVMDFGKQDGTMSSKVLVNANEVDNRRVHGVIS